MNKAEASVHNTSKNTSMLCWYYFLRIRVSFVSWYNTDLLSTYYTHGMTDRFVDSVMVH